jgi:hypothetical protein
MGLSFSSIFGFDDALLRFVKLLFQVPNPTLERAQVALGGQVERAGHLLHTLVHRPFDAPTETKALDHGLLNLRVLHELRNPGISKELEKAVFECSHRGGGELTMRS